MKPTKTLDQLITTLDRPTLLQCLGYLQRRRARDEVLQRLLEGRLASLMSAPSASNGHDGALLTVKEAAKRLRLRKARVYELVRERMLPKIAGLGKQVRIPASALNGTQAQKMA